MSMDIVDEMKQILAILNIVTEGMSQDMWDWYSEEDEDEDGEAIQSNYDFIGEMKNKYK